MRPCVFLVVTLGACLAAPLQLHAVGGTYIDNFLITNNGAYVLADNFDDGDIRDWNPAGGVSLAQITKKPAGYCMCFNSGGVPNAVCRRKVQAAPLGVLQVSAWFLMPPVEEQYGWDKDTGSTYVGSTVFYVAPDNNKDSVLFGVVLRPGDAGYRLDLKVHFNAQDGSRPGQLFRTQKPVLAPGKWALLTLKMDPSTRKVTLCLDGKEQLSSDYEPENWKSLTFLMVGTQLGDQPLKKIIK